MTDACIDHGCKGFGNGYATAWITIDGVKHTTTKHRKVYYELTGELPEVVRHTCDNPRCVNPKHLIGGSQKDNMQDMRMRGRSGDCRNFGVHNGRTVLTDNQVDMVRKTYIKGSKEFGLPSLSKQYGISIAQVYRIVKGVQRCNDHLKN